MKKYKAKKGLKLPILIALLSLLIVLVYYFKADYWLYLIPVFVAPLFISASMFFNTYYLIDKGLLKYQSGFLKGNIYINKIISIEKNKTMFSGLKPALAKNGLIIKYNKFDEIYIAPESNEELVSDLLELNSEIIVC